MLKNSRMPNTILNAILSAFLITLQAG